MQGEFLHLNLEFLLWLSCFLFFVFFFVVVVVMLVTSVSIFHVTFFCSWCWERLKARGEGDDRGWDGWMASPIQRTWVWVSSGSWWWTGRPGALQSSTPTIWGHCSTWGPKESDTTEQLNWTQWIVMSPKAVLVASWNQNSLNLALLSQVGNFPCLGADGNYCP